LQEPEAKTVAWVKWHYRLARANRDQGSEGFLVMYLQGLGDGLVQGVLLGTDASKLARGEDLGITSSTPVREWAACLSGYTGEALLHQVLGQPVDQDSVKLHDWISTFSMKQCLSSEVEEP
jgi:hypothetical protein